MRARRHPTRRRLIPGRRWRTVRAAGVGLAAVGIAGNAVRLRARGDDVVHERVRGGPEQSEDAQEQRERHSTPEQHPAIVDLPAPRSNRPTG